MDKKAYSFSYDVYGSAAELPTDDAALLARAQEATAGAYAPYSRFRVGAAARLHTGGIVTGANQENASFPAGICAERTLLSVIASLHPGARIDSMAISYDSDNGSSVQPISPCGICRQSLQEFVRRAGQDIRLILGGMQGPVYILPQASALMPLAFTEEQMH